MKKKEINLFAVFGLVLVLLLAAGFVGFSYYQHSCGVKALAQGDLNAAAEYIERDYLFSKREKEIVFIRWLLDQGMDDKAESEMARFPDEPVVRQMKEELKQKRDDLCFAEAQALLSEDKLDEAEARMRELKDPGRYDTATFYETLYTKRANRFLLAGKYEEALNCYQKLSIKPDDAHILETYEQGAYIQMARLAKKATQQNTSLLDEERWIKLLSDVEKNMDSGDVETYLKMEAALAVFREAEQMDSLGQLMEERYSDWWYPWILNKFQEKSSNSVLGIPASMEEVLSACATAPAGKILVVYQQDYYPDRTPVYAVDYDMMRLLPVQYVPESLAEVEYVIWVVSSYNDLGNYWQQNTATGEGKTVRGLQLTGLVKCLQMPGETELYRSQPVLGDRRLSVYYTDEDWASGTSPLLSDVLAKAFDKIPKPGAAA